MKDEMLMKFYKKVDCQAKMSFPKIVREMLGNEYYMEVYEDKIILIPIKKEK